MVAAITVVLTKVKPIQVSEFYMVGLVGRNKDTIKNQKEKRKTYSQKNYFPTKREEGKKTSFCSDYALLLIDNPQKTVASQGVIYYKTNIGYQ